jgi:CrcB protein
MPSDHVDGDRNPSCSSVFQKSHAALPDYWRSREGIHCAADREDCMAVSLLNVLPVDRASDLLNQNNVALSAPIAVSLGAIPGALSRYYITIRLAQWLGTSFPYGTFAINISGALLMGFITTLAIDRSIASPELQLLITTGFLGSYTTFSTYALDTSVLLRDGSRVRSLLYWAGSAVLGGIGLEMGIVLAWMAR